MLYRHILTSDPIALEPGQRLRTDRVIVIGAGIGGLTAALVLAADGLDVTVVERADEPGGKLREATLGSARIDAGPTVFTMRWVLEEILAAAGASLAAELTLRPAALLARHAWSERARLDLFADIERSADAVGAFAGAAEARRFRAFSARARSVYRALERPFIRAQRVSPWSLTRDCGLRGIGSLLSIAPHATLWQALGAHFEDGRLRQLFGRYATYVGSSPFQAPSTLMLIAHVEQDGVWLVEGGMHRIARLLARLAATKGARLRYAAEASEIQLEGGRVAAVRLSTGERIEADAVIVNADVASLAGGKLGRDAAAAVPAMPRAGRSLSAVTWALVAETEGFPLQRHNVFFSSDYAAEFEDIFRCARLPLSPTVYVCAQDRDGGADRAARGPERLLCLVNAPPTGDTHPFDATEIEQCADRTFGLLRRCGLTVRRRPELTAVTTPAGFERLFPGTGGALYGQATHGWKASFARPTARTRIPGLYLAGGSAHPGAGLPMAALSGRMAASCLMADRSGRSPARRMGGHASTPGSRPAATPGGTPTR
ncbi:MAG: phytoene desaturase [Alphaproteobacteria bacterium]|nr:phytoene desaturase [Alphaproteobacteria bacterium]